MGWEHYPLTFRMLSPLRVGWREAGNLQITRPYVTGKVLWGALTARLTRNLGEGGRGGAYRDVGENLRKYMRFGYLWPSVNPPEPCYPWDAPEDFAYRFIDSYVSTAQNAGIGSAEDGSLHETEFIAPYTRQGEPVFLVGSLWVEETCPYPVQQWQEALAQVQLGGERRYGWGRVRLETPLHPQERADIPDIENFTWEGPIPAHLAAPENGSVKVSDASLEPLVGWEMTAEGGKRVKSISTAAYVPGAKVPNSRHLSIGPCGIWKIKS